MQVASRTPKARRIVASRNLGLIAGPVIFFVVLAGLPASLGLSKEGVAVLAATLWVAIWWVTEAIPLAATALLPIVLFPLTGAVSIQATSAQYGHRYIFLYVGGFLLAIGIEKWGLHKRIALQIVMKIGTSASRILLGFMVATAALSMWISNTATSVMMLPIAMAVVQQMRSGADEADNELDDEADNHVTPFGKALMLAIAYSASIGGMATLVGTPPNLVFAGLVQEQYGVEISFAQWMQLGLPISLLLLAIGWWYLTRIAFRVAGEEFGGADEIRRQVAATPPLTQPEVRLLVVFVLTASAWIGRSFVQKQLGWIPHLDDTIIAMISGIALFIIPSGQSDRPAEAILEWKDTARLPWGIVLLFGGGMALAEGFQSSGLAEWIGTRATLLDGLPLLLVLIVLITAVNLLTEVTSNLATTSMLLPILASIAMSLNVHPLLLLVAATTAASCAFMLPVATPPNAVVFGSGYLRIPDMVRVGLGMNLISIGVLTVCVYWLLPWLWELQIDRFTDQW